jgi:uncharacterized protein YndB with AHSA1/START domain
VATHDIVVEDRLAISAPPSAVFAMLADPAEWFAQDEALVDVAPREPLVAGSAGTMRRRVGLSLTVKTGWRNVEFVPGGRLVNVITGFGYELREAVILAPREDGGTEMVVVDTLSPTSIVGRVMVAMSRRIIERDLHARFARLKEQVEARPPAVS